MPHPPSCPSFFACSEPPPLLSVCLSSASLLFFFQETVFLSPTLPSPELFFWIPLAFGPLSPRIPTSRPSRHPILF